MKRTNKLKRMYALLVAVAACIGITIYASCSADEDYDGYSSKNELFTLADGIMERGTEYNMPFSFIGIPVTGNIAYIQNLTVLADWAATFYMEWTTGYTGNIVSPFSRLSMTELEMSEDTFTYIVEQTFKREFSNISATCKWNYLNEAEIVYRFNCHYWHYKYNPAQPSNSWVDEGEQRDSLMKTIGYADLLSYCVNDYNDSIPENNP